MIFAHGPLGFLLAATQRKKARTLFRFTNRQWVALLLIGYIGGIFPDIDLFFFYFVNAEQSHRELITHTPILYIVTFIVVSAIAWAWKKQKLILGAWVFMLGALSHLLTDMVAAKIMILYPVSSQLFGIQDFGIPTINANTLFLNFLMEGIIIFFFLYLLIHWIAKELPWRILAVTTLLCVFAAGVATIVIGNQHVYHDPNDSHYGDIDGDGTPNYADRDVDGDGQLNIDDLDADGDYHSNAEEIILNAEKFIDVWYDPTEGGLARIPARLGLMTNRDIVWRLFESVGIPIEVEMAEDFLRNPEGYRTSPADDNFDRDPENIYTWVRHTHRLTPHPATTQNHIGDILFFENGVVSVVTGFTNEAVPLVLDVHKDRQINEIPLSELVELQGPVRGRAHLIDSAPLFGQED